MYFYYLMKKMEPQKQENINPATIPPAKNPFNARNKTYSTSEQRQKFSQPRATVYIRAIPVSVVVIRRRSRCRSFDSPRILSIRHLSPESSMNMTLSDIQSQRTPLLDLLNRSDDVRFSRTCDQFFHG